MKMSFLRQFLAIVLMGTTLLATSPMTAQEAQQANLSASEIDSIVSPIALYPDQLIAQILGAATYPDQVSAADKWLESNGGLKGDAVMQAADKQPWDPSVKALTQFPSVLDQMANNLAWTSALGDAAYNQQKDVMASIQRLRAQAKAAGNLKSTEQIKVVQQDPQTIVIQPANPQVVYVPQYNPSAVYGTPYQPPGYSTGAMVATGLISFGLGVAVGAAINNNNSCCGWGYGGWNTNWHGGNVVYQNNVYVSRSNTFYGTNRNAYRNTYYGGNRPANYNANNRYNYNGGNNKNVNVSGNTVNVNTGGNRNTVNNTGGNRNTVNNGSVNSNINSGNRNANANRNADANANRSANANRENASGNRNADANRQGAGNRSSREAEADRGYGQRAQTNSGAFGGYKEGGTARAEANRGIESMGGGGRERAERPARGRR